jgi:hypothetical protein
MCTFRRTFSGSVYNDYPSSQHGHPDAYGSRSWTIYLRLAITHHTVWLRHSDERGNGQKLVPNILHDLEAPQWFVENCHNHAALIGLTLMPAFSTLRCRA